MNYDILAVRYMHLPVYATSLMNNQTAFECVVKYLKRFKIFHDDRRELI